MRYYTSDHLWVEVKGKDVFIGLTQFGIEQHGEIVYLELPRVGLEMRAGEEFAVIESVKAASDLYSPVSGKVVEVNEALANTLDTLNQSPEREWLVHITLNAEIDPREFFDKERYDQVIAGA